MLTSWGHSGEGSEQFGVRDHAAARRRYRVRGPAEEDAACSGGCFVRAHVRAEVRYLMFVSYTPILTDFYDSQAAAAVSLWTSELTAKGRSKIAATIADPAANPELFEEGWEAVLAREEELLSCMPLSPFATALVCELS